MKKRQVFPLVVLLVLLVWLVACSGEGTEENTPVPAATSSSTLGQDENDPRPEAPTAEIKVETTRLVATPAGEGWVDWDGSTSVAPISGESLAGGPPPAGTAMPFADDSELVIAEPVEMPAASLLTAGEVDDNAQWDDYLLYLRDYVGPMVLPIDISERHQIWVKNEQGQPQVAVLIQIQANGQEVARLRTHSDGRAYFFPRALPTNVQADEYTLMVENAAQLLVPAGGSQREWQMTIANVSQPQTVKLDILFLIDTTGSMADEIQQLRDNIQSIASQIDALPSRPDVRFAMTIYRDRGDEYLTRTFDFTPDVNFFAEGLAQVQANGGGDTPEDLNEALFRAIHVPEWRVENSISLIFLVADAAPHLDYADQEASYAIQVMEAAERGIKIIPIASSGLDNQGEYIFRQLAQITGGRFVFLTYGSAGAGTTGSETTMTVDDYTVSALDDLIVQIVEEELSFLNQ